jgi:hypothetical protein
MRIAKELGKSVKEVMQFDVQEINLWAAWFKKEHEVMNKHGENRHRNPRSR